MIAVISRHLGNCLSDRSVFDDKDCHVGWVCNFIDRQYCAHCERSDLLLPLGVIARRVGDIDSDAAA